MIGPHEGKELELMLAGKKHLAVFSDAVIQGQEIPEEIIPEQAFAPYVAKGEIKRFSRDFISPKLPYPGRHVCFTLPEHEWRAETFLWLYEKGTQGILPFDETFEKIIGNLLEYEKNDVEDYIQKSFKT